MGIQEYLCFFRAFSKEIFFVHFHSYRADFAVEQETNFRHSSKHAWKHRPVIAANAMEF